MQSTQIRYSLATHTLVAEATGTAFWQRTPDRAVSQVFPTSDAAMEALFAGRIVYRMKGPLEASS